MPPIYPPAGSQTGTTDIAADVIANPLADAGRQPLPIVSGVVWALHWSALP